MRVTRQMRIPLIIGVSGAAVNILMFIAFILLPDKYNGGLRVFWLLSYPGVALCRLLEPNPHSIRFFVLILVLSPVVTGACWFTVAWTAQYPIVRISQRPAPKKHQPT